MIKSLYEQIIENSQYIKFNEHDEIIGVVKDVPQNVKELVKKYFEMCKKMTSTTQEDYDYWDKKIIELKL